jgi:acetyl-CoA carboxylase biotin carboxyl carrier protein
MDDLNNKLNVIDCLMKHCEQSKLLLFSYQDAKFSVHFSKIDHNANVYPKTEVDDGFELDSSECAVTNVSQINKQKEDNIEMIISPFVGRIEFSDQIKLADEVIHIDKGEVICSVEAMKIYNDIKAQVSGIIVEILVKDCSLVEYGQPLLKIRVDEDKNEEI